MDEQISKKAALVAVKDALMAWSYMPEWRDEKILEAQGQMSMRIYAGIAPNVAIDRRTTGRINSISARIAEQI